MKSRSFPVVLVAVSIAVLAVLSFASTTGAQTGTPDMYEPDNSFGEAKSIATDGSVQTHNFHAAWDNDWAKFVASGGMQYTIETSNLGSRCDTVLYLYDTDGRP
jgi:hypothetical protein